MSPTLVKWALLVAGVLTLTMVYAAIAPQAAVQSTFGETVEGPAAEIIIRNWGALIALIGAMLIYAAFDPSVRPLVLMVAGASKLIFISLVLAHGREYLDEQVGIAVATDSVMVVFFVVCLAKGTRKVMTA